MFVLGLSMSPFPSASAPWDCIHTILTALCRHSIAAAGHPPVAIVNRGKLLKPTYCRFLHRRSSSTQLRSTSLDFHFYSTTRFLAECGSNCFDSVPNLLPLYLPKFVSGPLMFADVCFWPIDFWLIGVSLRLTPSWQTSQAILRVAPSPGLAL